MNLFDSHAHLDDIKFDEDRDNIIKKIKEKNNVGFVSIGYNLNSSKKAVELSKKYEYIYATCGISPNDIPQTIDELWKDISKIKQIIQINNIKENKIVAIGEIGLDYYWNKDNKNIQKQAFIKQIELANELDLPITIHCREAIDNTLEILRKNNVINKGIFHCCPLNKELIKQALELGFYISFSGSITFKNSKNADEVIKLVPLDKLLIETDSPYLSPEPYRGKRNDPRNVIYVAQKISDVTNIELSKIADITYENAKKIYKIKSEK